MRKIQRSVIGGLLCGMIAIHAVFFWNAWRLTRQGYSDFASFYTAGTIVLAGLGHHLYEPAVQYSVQHRFAPEVQIRKGPLPYSHPPFEALVFAPFSTLKYETAYVLWNVLNLAMLGIVFCLLRHQLPILRSVRLWLWLVVWLAFFPIYACFLQGQDSILLLLLYTLGCRALIRNDDFLAGAWLGLSTFKFQFVIPLVLLLVLWKRRRVLAGFAATGSILIFLSAALVGWRSLFQYPTYALQLARWPDMGDVAPALLPNLRGLIQGWSLNIPLTALNGLAIAASLGLIAFGWWSGRALPPRYFNLQFSLAVIVSVLVAWHTNAHDLSLLILPLVLLFEHSRSVPADARHRSGALLIPVIPIWISPLWLVLWLLVGKVNLMAIPLLWWAWEIGKEALSAGASMSLQPEKRFA